MKQADLVQGRTYALEQPRSGQTRARTAHKSSLPRGHSPPKRQGAIRERPHRRTRRLDQRRGTWPVAGANGKRSCGILKVHQRLVAANRAIWGPRDGRRHRLSVMTASGEYGGYLSRWVSGSGSGRAIWPPSQTERFAHRLRPEQLHRPTRGMVAHLRDHAARRAGLCGCRTTRSGVIPPGSGRTDSPPKGWQPGNRGAHEQLREWSPRWALARSWTQRPLGDAWGRRRCNAFRPSWAESVQLLRQLGHELHATQIESSAAEVGRRPGDQSPLSSLALVLTNSSSQRQDPFLVGGWRVRGGGPFRLGGGSSCSCDCYVGPRGPALTDSAAAPALPSVEALLMPGIGVARGFERQSLTRTWLLWCGS